MKTWFAVLAFALCAATARGISMRPPPAFDEVTRSAAFIGVVEVTDVPQEPSGGFWSDKPPLVTVKIVESWKGAARDTSHVYLWDTGFRPEALMSYSSFMLPPDPAKLQIALPPKGQRLVVFAETLKDGAWRDIYGWLRRPVVQDLPPGHPDQRSIPSWSPSSDHCIRVTPLQEIGQTLNFYGRQKLLYTSDPDDARTKAALRWTDISRKGEYWILTYSTAVKMTVTAIEANPDWPVRYTVQAGDAVASIAQKFYDDEAKSEQIVKANGIRNPVRIRPGMVLKIPPVPDYDRGRGSDSGKATPDNAHR